MTIKNHNNSKDPGAGLVSYNSPRDITDEAYPWNARDNFWSTFQHYYDPALDRSTQTQCIYPRGMAWPWGQAILDMDRTTVQLGARGMPAESCNEICRDILGDNADKETFAHCLYSKHGKTCVAESATVTQVIPNYTLPDAVTPY